MSGTRAEEKGGAEGRACRGRSQSRFEDTLSEHYEKSLTSLRSGLSRERGRPPDKSTCSGDIGEPGARFGDARE